MNKFIQSVIAFLELRKPYRIILQSSMRVNAATYTAHHTTGGKLLRHIIKINMANLEHDDRDLNTLIAHEFIHAWQEERKFKDIHGKSFQRMAKQVGEEFGIDKLYMPDRDIP